DAAVVWSPSAARSLPAPYNNNHILNNNNNNNLYPALTTAPSMVVAASTAVSTVPALITSAPLVIAPVPVSTSYGVPHGSYTTVAPGFRVNQLGHTGSLSGSYHPVAAVSPGHQFNHVAQT
ncbi:unnamed protein product, partial [Polarella glacialis]